MSNGIYFKHYIARQFTCLLALMSSWSSCTECGFLISLTMPQSPAGFVRENNRKETVSYKTTCSITTDHRQEIHRLKATVLTCSRKWSDKLIYLASASKVPPTFVFPTLSDL